MRRNAFIGQVATWVICLLIIGGAVAGSALLRRQVEPESSAKANAALPLVQTEAIRQHEGTLDISVDGVVVPYREILLAAEVAGRIVYKSEACKAGRYVTKGTALLRIDPRDYELAVERLRSELAQAEANLNELQVEITNTEALIKLAEEQWELERREVNRLATLIQERVVTDSEMDRARQSELTIKNNLTQWQNQLRLQRAKVARLTSARDLVRADLDKAELDLQRTEIAAPIDGVVVSDLVEQDSYVQKGATLCRLEDTSAVEVKCRLRMEQLHWIWRQSLEGSSSARGARSEYRIPPTPVTVSYRFAGGQQVRYQWQGELTRYDGLGLDESTRTIPCRVLVKDPQAARAVDERSQPRSDTAAPALVRGMFVTVTLHVQSPAPLVLIPERAVQPGKAVWVVRGGRLELVKSLPLIELTEGPAENGYRTFWLAEATASGVTTDDRVVVPPLPILHEGMAVREADAI